jgi:uncharacterized protein (TIGR02452 family)
MVIFDYLPISDRDWLDLTVAPCIVSLASGDAHATTLEQGADLDLVNVARETLSIVDGGTYATPSGVTVDVRGRIDTAVRGTVLYTPADLAALTARRGDVRTIGHAATRIDVTPETTAAAARRLWKTEERDLIAALNFASARHPGGGFLGGARAQEEDLARCSALYACLLTQPRYYEANRAHDTPLYTDHVIYAPDVPFFRDDDYELLDEPFLVSIVTAPAPNAGALPPHWPDARASVRATLESRAANVLAVAADRGHRRLVLGAWGCGVFRNDPEDVAAVFAACLASPHFEGAFDHVVFAVYDRSRDRTTLRAFRNRFDRR